MQDPNTTLAAARRGNKSAITALVDMLYPRIYPFLRRLTSNDADAADLTQKTFVQFWKSLPTFTQRSSLSSWVHSIAYYVYVDWVRSNHRTDAKPAEWWADLPSAAARPDELVSRSDAAEEVYRQVDRLEPDLRNTIHLHYYQELTLEETAEAMGVATSTVKYRLRQAFKILQREIQSQNRLTANPSNFTNFL